MLNTNNKKDQNNQKRQKNTVHYAAGVPGALIEDVALSVVGLIIELKKLF